MTNVLAAVAVENNAAAVYADFMGTFERRVANIKARIETGFVLYYDNGLCVGQHDGKFCHVGYELCTVFATAKEAAEIGLYISNLKGERPEVVSAAKARFRSLGKVLHAMALINEGMGK